MAMDQFLAEYYGTATPAQDDNEKTAQVELFAKLAAAEGIDLNSLSDAQVEELYTATFSKEASDESEESDKKEQAKEEHEEKKAAAEKFAEADYMGRVMAHAYVQEMRKIAEAGGNFDKEAGVGDWAKKTWESGKGHASKAWEATKGHAGKAKEKVVAGAKATGEHLKTHQGKYYAGAGGVAAGGAGGYAAGRSKKASAIDELAGELACEKAASAGWDVNDVAQRVRAVLVLGAPEEGSKIAQAANVDQAIDIRSSELLELAGYPVQWA